MQLVRAPTSIVATVDWPNHDCNYEEDAEEFITQAKEREQNQEIEKEEKVPVDPAFHFTGHAEVFYDDEQ